MSAGRVYELRPAVQHNSWGKVGSASLVARLTATEVDEDRPYAELWMGTHAKLPSRLAGTGQDLKSFIADNPHVLGKDAAESDRGLPFLLKVLSIGKVLSLQAHPDKALAERLHARRPDLYLDDNHKPEMVIALTPFEALCGFRPIADVVASVAAVPELRSAIGRELAARMQGPDARNALKDCFARVMCGDKSATEEQLRALIERVAAKTSLSDDERLLLRVHGDFPADRACFAVFFLAHVRLRPGEALFVGAGVPHAYVRGDCVECMACSDNVLRAGFTSKRTYSPAFCRMLDYAPSAARKLVPRSSPRRPCELVYAAPAEEFVVVRVRVASGTAEKCEFAARDDGASIVLFLQGNGAVEGNDGLRIRPGTVLFLPAGCRLCVRIAAGGEIDAYRAMRAL